MLVRNRAHRLDRRLVVGAVVALSLAPVAEGLEGAPRLSQRRQTRQGGETNHRLL